MKYFSQLRQNLGPGVDGWAMSLRGMMSIVMLMGFTICFLYWWVNNNVQLPTRSLKKKVFPYFLFFFFVNLCMLVFLYKSHPHIPFRSLMVALEDCF